MEIEGTYTLQAPAEEVWNCLMDRQTIQHTIPGLERLTKVDDQRYAFVINIRHAPLRGNYSGSASILEPSYPSGYRLKIEGEGTANTFQGECTILLSSRNENTVVSYRGSLQPGHGSVRISTPLLKATVKVLLQQFFTALADRLRTERRSLVSITALEEVAGTPFLEEKTSEQFREMSQSSHSPLLYLLVRRVGLGGSDPELEEQWVRRLRQIGLVAIFLLLVWLGTRLPRRNASET
jgi:carbon monoxide dehydrogenase subunit G